MNQAKGATTAGAIGGAMKTVVAASTGNCSIGVTVITVIIAPIAIRLVDRRRIPGKQNTRRAMSRGD